MISDFFDNSDILSDVVGDNAWDFILFDDSLPLIVVRYSSLLWVDADGLGTGLRSSSVASSADLADHDEDAESDSELRMTIGNGKLHFFVLPHDFRMSSTELEKSFNQNLQTSKSINMLANLLLAINTVRF